VPGLSDLPVLGRIFSFNDDVANKTEIVLLVTPRIVRNINQPEARLQEFNSGTEAEVGGAPLGLPPGGFPSPGPVVPTQPFPQPQPAPQTQPQPPAPPAPTLPTPAPFSGVPPAAGPQPKPAAP
jgi:general secretion pathway protein D